MVIVAKPKHFGDFKGIPKSVDLFVRELVLKYQSKFHFKNKDKPTGLYKIWDLIMQVIVKGEIRKRVISNVLDECWVPSNFFLRGDLAIVSILAHEMVHMFDTKRLGVFAVTLLYFFPQLLALLSLLALLAAFPLFGGLGWLAFLSALVFIAPFPSPGRMWMELRGYRMEMMIGKHFRKETDAELQVLAERLSLNFTESTYYFMWPFKGWVVKKLLAFEEFENEEPYVEVVGWLRANIIIP